MAALGLLVLLTAASALLPPDPDQGVNPAFWNLQVKPNVRRLSWELGAHGPKDSRVLCQKGNQTTVVAFHNQNFCSFYSLSLCNVTRFSVFMEDDKNVSAWIWFPKEDPNRGAAARDLQCWVPGLNTLSCTWAPGLKAPDDVNYRMYWRDAGHGNDRDQECEHYGQNSRKVNVHCDVSNIRGFPVLLMVTVTGSSRKSAVSCSDWSVDLHNVVEVLSPPEITLTCNGSSVDLSWDMKSLVGGDFRYELEIRRMATDMKNVSGNSFQLQQGGTGSVRIRAKPEGKDYTQWGKWQRFDCLNPEKTQVLSTVSFTLVALGLVLTALVVVLIWRRSSLRHRLCPPIPAVKGVLIHSVFFLDPEVMWVEANLPETSLEPEEILQVEEMQ